MTVHASKGLEFPIVFVVNMGRGTGGFRAPIRVAADAGGEASVAIADYQSEADARMREARIAKRRSACSTSRSHARDRWYLASTVEEGACRMGRGSLGEVLPSSVKQLFVAAAGSKEMIVWTGPGGRTHRLGVLSTTTAQPTVSRELQPLPATPLRG